MNENNITQPHETHNRNTIFMRHNMNFDIFLPQFCPSEYEVGVKIGLAHHFSS